MNQDYNKYRIQVTADAYEKHAFHPIRIESITEQLRQICYSGYTNILEIGVGKGFLRQCFQLFPHISHTAIDIAEDLHPDYVGSVTEMPFKDKQFDVVVCGEVLEHLPFTEFLPALKEISYKGTLRKDVVKKIKEAGFRIEKQYRLWKHPWHCFFILGV